MPAPLPSNNDTAEFDLAEGIFSSLKDGPLCESQLSVNFGVSTGAIRRQLLKLEEEGVVEQRKDSGCAQSDPLITPWGLSRPFWKFRKRSKTKA